MAETEMPIFTRTFDLLSWLLPATHYFPRIHRHSATQNLLDGAFDLRERLEEANLRRGTARRPAPIRVRRQGTGADPLAACGALAKWHDEFAND
jgi:hypothetical protein